MDVLLLLSLIGAVMGVLLSLSPVPAFITAYKLTSVKEISRGFIVVFNLAAASWVFYAFKASISDIIVPNAIQFCISFILISVYHHLRGDSVLAVLKYGSLISVLAILAALLGNAEQLGLVAVTLNTLSNLAPMDQVVSVLRERKADYLDMTVNTTSFLYNLIWLAFGIVARNPYITFPNAFGVGTSSILFGLHFWAKSKACRPADKKGSDETSHLT